VSFSVPSVASHTVPASRRSANASPRECTALKTWRIIRTVSARCGSGKAPSASGSTIACSLNPLWLSLLIGSMDLPRAPTRRFCPAGSCGLQEGIRAKEVLLKVEAQYDKVWCGLHEGYVPLASRAVWSPAAAPARRARTQRPEKPCNSC
jgi:hypothetical protein